MIKTPILLQDMRKKIYIQVKTEEELRLTSVGILRACV